MQIGYNQSVDNTRKMWKLYFFHQCLAKLFFILPYYQKNIKDGRRVYSGKKLTFVKNREKIYASLNSQIWILPDKRKLVVLFKRK